MYNVNKIILLNNNLINRYFKNLTIYQFIKKPRTYISSLLGWIYGLWICFIALNGQVFIFLNK